MYECENANVQVKDSLLYFLPTVTDRNPGDTLTTYLTMEDGSFLPEWIVPNEENDVM